MVRKKGSFEEWAEPQDEAAAEVEVTDEGYDEEPATVEPTLKVKIKEQPAPTEPEVSPTTKAEMEAGAKAIVDKKAAP